MKPHKSLVLILFLSYYVSACAQPAKLSKEQKRYNSEYDSKKISPENIPLLLPYNRWIDPAGKSVSFGNPGLENHALDLAISPDEKWLAVEGRYEVIIMSVQLGKVVANLPLRGLIKNENLMNTFSGIKWLNENDSLKLFWSSVGDKKTSYVLCAMWDGKNLSFSNSYPFVVSDPAGSALPNEVLPVTEGNRSFLYVVLNGNNQVCKLDIRTKEKIWTTNVGVAPFGIASARNKLYVTNWAGGVPAKEDIHIAGVPWGSAKVDSINGSTREGSVSVLDTQTGNTIREIRVGLHPNDIIASPDGKFIYVANANSDAVSVISTQTEEVIETISVRLSPEKNTFWGDSPNGLGLTPDGNTLYVANGMDNALAVIELGKESGGRPSVSKSQLKGFIPTETYPGAVAISGNNQLFVANIEGHGAFTPNISSKTGKPSYNSHQLAASVSIIPVPSEKELKDYTARTEKSNQLFRLDLLNKLPRKNTKPVPVPERIGEPSVFKHVLYIIKENRTYDQILGDMKKGEGDSTLTIFGQKVTPNTHKLCDEFMLLDNFYVSGKCSAEGHQWTDASIVTDYIEKDVRAWIRSYPHVQEDALVYAPTGFIWDNAMKHHKNVRIYGEASVPRYDKSYTWTSIYDNFLKGEKFEFVNTTTIKPVEPILSQNYPSYDDHRIPDAIRAQAFIKELHDYEAMEGDQLPELMIMALPNDHTGGSRPGLPTPRAMVADNDLALGQIIEALSKSRFWNNTVVFITEDDSQSGWDHVSPYRTIGMILSPYTKTGTVLHSTYNQPSMVRTIEQILGLPPMNIMDATARPMFDCFSSKPDFTPFTAVPNQIPLNEMNPSLTSLHGKELFYAQKSMEPQFDGIDSGDDDLFNRIIWFATRGEEKYPRKFAGKDLD